MKPAAISKSNLRQMAIVTMRHGKGYKAYLEDDPGIWEFGVSTAGAIGRLIQTLAYRAGETWVLASIKERNP